MSVGCHAAAVARWQAYDERAVRMVLQGVELGLDAGQIRKGVHALAALAELARSLMTSQKQGGKKSDRRRTEIVVFGVKVVPVLGHARARLAELKGPLALAQTIEGADDGGLVKVGHRVPIGGLIAGGDEGVQSEGIRVRDEDFFFQQAAKDA